MGNADWNTRVTLLEKIKDRYDDHAWEDFIYYYQKYIFVILNSMGVPEKYADELCHKIMISLWKKLPDFSYEQNKGRFRTWLCRVVQNQVRNFYRDQSALKRQDCAMPADEIPQLSDESEMEKLAEREWNVYVAKLAWETISKELPEHYRIAFEMHLCGKSTDEIVEATPMNANTLFACLKRCRDRLKAEIRRLTNELL